MLLKPSAPISSLQTMRDHPITTLAVDAMGGDLGLAATIPAACEVLARYSEVVLILVGDPARIEQELANVGMQIGARLKVVGSSQVVEMSESPTLALRKKKDSSMRVAINLVHDGVADACISSGNTGALMATARFVLKTIPGIARPAICTALPRAVGQTYMLDLGANVDSPPQLLFQFALMGSMLVRCIEGNANPTVGLLNIGIEDIKGSDTIKSAAKLIKESEINYIGYVEADSIYVGNTDLVVCDGFAGNVALKSAEGVAQMIREMLRDGFNRNLMTRASGMLVKPILSSITGRLDHRKYNGASLLGLKGTVVKSHGSADAFSFRCALEFGIKAVQAKLVQQIERALMEHPELMATTA